MNCVLYIVYVYVVESMTHSMRWIEINGVCESAGIVTEGQTFLMCCA